MKALPRGRARQAVIAREGFLEELARSGAPDAASQAIDHLGDASPLVRIAALECLAQRGTRRHLPAVIRALRDADALVRLEAVECVVTLRGHKAWKELLPRLNDRDGLVRAYAAWALGNLRARSAIGVIEKRLKSERSRLARVGLLEALAVMTRKAAWVDELVKRLGSADYRVRCFAANSLVGVAAAGRPEAALQALERALEAESLPSVRAVLRENLRAVRGVARGSRFGK